MKIVKKNRLSLTPCLKRKHPKQRRVAVGFYCPLKIHQDKHENILPLNFNFLLNHFTRKFFTPLYCAFQPRVGNKVTILNPTTLGQMKKNPKISNWWGILWFETILALQMFWLPKLPLLPVPNFPLISDCPFCSKDL